MLSANKLRSLSVTSILLALCACQTPPAPASDKASQGSAQTGTPSAKDGLPPGHPPVPSGSQPAAAEPTGPAVAGELTWNDAKPLVRRAPKSSMRAAEYGVEGDDRSELTVFYFGEGQGGAVDANLDRWIGQFAQADGSDSKQKAKQSERESNGIKVHLVEVTGKYAGGMGMGPASNVPIDDAMLLGAIAMGPKGPVFFKLTGPRTAVEHAREGFMRLVKSVRLAGAAAKP